MSSGQHVCRSGKPPPQPTTVEVFRLARGFSRPHAGRTAQPLAQVKSSLLGKADRPKTLSPRHVRHGASPHVSMTLKPPPHTHLDLKPLNPVQDKQLKYRTNNPTLLSLRPKTCTLCLEVETTAEVEASTEAEALPGNSSESALYLQGNVRLLKAYIMI